MKKMRSHPINILENTSRYLILLVFPLIRALLASKDGFYTWLSGAWFDLLIICAILVFGIYSWYVYTFSFNDDGITIVKGVFLKQERFLPFRNMTAISVEAPWFFRPIRAVRLRADTDAGSSRKADFVITIRTDFSEEILDRSKQPFTREQSLSKIYIPRNLYIAILSFLTSNSLSGVIYLYTAFTQAGDILGKEFSNHLMNRFTEAAKLVSFGLPPMFAVIGYIILICWGIAFLLNMARHLRFSVLRRDGIIDIKSGLFTVRRYSITVKRINYITLRQSLFSKLFGFMSVFIHCTGYGKEKSELSVLLPAGLRHEINSNLKILLPGLPFAKRQIKPKLVNISRFLIPPVTLILAVLGAGLLALHFFYTLYNAILFLLIVIEIPCVWWLVLKTYAYFFTGIGMSEEAITLYYTRGFRIITSSIPLHKISKIETMQTLFQLTTKCCNVNFYTYAESIKKQEVINLYLPEVMDLLDLYREKLPEINHVEPKEKI